MPATNHPEPHGVHISAEQATHIISTLGGIQQAIKSQGDQITQQNAQTNMRIDDMRRSMEIRLEGHDRRISTLESNERSTAIKTSGLAGLTGAVAGFLTAMLRSSMGHP